MFRAAGIALVALAFLTSCTTNGARKLPPDRGAASRLKCVMAWHSGFELPFPGHWLNKPGLDYSARTTDGTVPPGHVEAWTIVDKSSGEPVHSGQHAYKGWITGPTDKKSHRAYPVVELDIPTPVVNSFWVYLDADYAAMNPLEWIHFGTWGNWDPKTNVGAWALHTMSVRGRKLGFAHATPFRGEYIGPKPRPDFPLRRWVRLTMYIDYEGADGFIQVWQDGTPMLRATLPKNPGRRLRTAHWGMYAAGTVKSGIEYNDDISIWRLQKPLTDFTTEPRCDR